MSDWHEQLNGMLECQDSEEMQLQSLHGLVDALIEESSQREAAAQAAALEGAAKLVRTFNNAALCDLATEIEQLATADQRTALDNYVESRLAEALVKTYEAAQQALYLELESEIRNSLKLHYDPTHAVAIERAKTLLQTAFQVCSRRPTTALTAQLEAARLPLERIVHAAARYMMTKPEEDAGPWCDAYDEMHEEVSLYFGSDDEKVWKMALDAERVRASRETP